MVSSESETRWVAALNPQAPTLKLGFRLAGESLGRALGSLEHYLKVSTQPQKKKCINQIGNTHVLLSFYYSK